MKIKFDDETDEERVFKDLNQETYEAILKFAIKEVEKQHEDELMI